MNRSVKIVVLLLAALTALSGLTWISKKFVLAKLEN